MSLVVAQDLLERLGRIGLSARHAVESALAGQHRSIRRGLSVQFAGHRPYQAGDDLRHLDWSVYARSDRFDVRVFEEETRLRATIILDASGSMSYGSGLTKIDFARQVAAALAFLLVHHADAVGLAVVDTEVREHLPAASTTAHLGRILEALEAVRCGGETALGPVIQALAQRITRRGVVVVITDACDDPEALLLALRLLIHRRQDVRLLRIIDPDEETLPYAGTVRFDGLEAEGSLLLDADRVRPHYQAAWMRHARRLAEGCHALGIAVEVLRSNEDLALAVGRVLMSGRTLR